MALLIPGYRAMPKLFANRWTRSELDRLCEQSTRRAEEMRELKRKSDSAILVVTSAENWAVK
jgi:hypothetical protein